jgi:hypothetical protein
MNLIEPWTPTQKALKNSIATSTHNSQKWWKNTKNPTKNMERYSNKYPPSKKKTNITIHNSPGSRRNKLHWKTNRLHTENRYYASSSKLMV